MHPQMQIETNLCTSFCTHAKFVHIFLHTYPLSGDPADLIALLIEQTFIQTNKRNETRQIMAPLAPSRTQSKYRRIHNKW